ncbi:class I SAM-dependent methyltransferase [Actinophytocola sp.]|uniref:class I SAM-dependent DNA methyltransferase n=1 Tax=Actinophytocola sp. TaxID=1872138 RepID=UPI002ED0A48F
MDDTRRSYDATAEDYATWIDGELTTKPFDRAMLTAFAELATGPVVDVGCGTGRVTAFLRDRGVSAFGIDLSPRMIEIARRTYPDLRFTEGTMTALAIEDATLGGVVAWYPTIHVPDSQLPTALAEFHRVLTPGGHLLLAFQAGDEVVHRTRAGTHDVSLHFHHRQPDHMAELLAAAGFTVRATLHRAPDEGGDYPEDTAQAYMLARRVSVPL